MEIGIGLDAMPFVEKNNRAGPAALHDPGRDFGGVAADCIETAQVPTDKKQAAPLELGMKE